MIKPLKQVFVWCGVDNNGEEGIAGVRFDMNGEKTHWFPLMYIDEASADRYEEMAREVMTQTGDPLTLKKYVFGQDIKSIEIKKRTQ